jgi:uncharacterized protein YhbP (UPF0306 family)
LEVNLVYCPEYYVFCEQWQNTDILGGEKTRQIKLQFDVCASVAAHGRIPWPDT